MNDDDALIRGDIFHSLTAEIQMIAMWWVNAVFFLQIVNLLGFTEIKNVIKCEICEWLNDSDEF